MKKTNTAHQNAKEIIKRHADNTCYFDCTITTAEMYEMFRERFGFGNAEAQVIIAALTLAGAQWKPSSKPAGYEWDNDAQIWKETA